MRARYLRTAVVGGLLAVTAAVAQPPFSRTPTASGQKLKEKLKDATESLKMERKKLAKEAAPDAGNAAERMLLRATLLKKIQELGEKRSAPPVVTPPPKPMPPPTGLTPNPNPPAVGDGTTSLDPLREAQNLYQAGHTDAAYRALQFQMQ